MECHFKLLSLYKNNNLVFHVFNIYLNLNNAPRRLYLLVTFRISSFCFHLNPVIFKFGFPGGAVVKNAPASTRDRRCGLDPWVGKIDPLEEEMATHSSILSWRIPWTEEPVGLQSMGSQTVGHNWATDHAHITKLDPVKSTDQSLGDDLCYVVKVVFLLLKNQFWCN